MRNGLKALVCVSFSLFAVHANASTTDTLILVHKTDNHLVKEYNSFKEYSLNMSKLYEKLDKFERLSKTFDNKDEIKHFNCVSLANLAMDGLKLNELNRRHLIRQNYSAYAATSNLFKSKYNAYVEEGSCQKMKLV